MKPFTATKAASVSAWGETKLIRAISTWLGDACPLGPEGIGDDCALLAGSPKRQLVTVDPVIYGEHFDDSLEPGAVGAKLLKRNLSDIAAMGGRPRAAVVALALDPGVSRRWLAGFYRGMARVALRYAVPVVGGDVARLKGGLVATLTLIGEATGSRVLARTGAREGDWIYVTGRLGGSRLGYHWRFLPRLAEGQWLAGRAEVRSMIDISDGLAKDLTALTPPGCRAELLEADIPVSRSARTLARSSGRPALAHALGDGEDYELLFTVNGATARETFEQAWAREFPLRLTCLGRFVSSGRPRAAGTVDLRDYHGFEHLR
jgi:thiamine-monophosphate kinase